MKAHSRRLGDALNRGGLHVSNRFIGGGAYGKVYHGHIPEGRGKKRKVAVKKFHLIPTREERKAIAIHGGLHEIVWRELREAGVPLPQVAFFKWKNPETGKTEHVQVMELFESVKQPFMREDDKVRQLGRTSRGSSEILAKAVRRERFRNKVLDVVAKVINAGYPFFLDGLGAVNLEKKPQPIIFDFDHYVAARMYRMGISRKVIEENFQFKIEGDFEKRGERDLIKLFSFFMTDAEVRGQRELKMYDRLIANVTNERMSRWLRNLRKKREEHLKQRKPI